MPTDKNFKRRVRSRMGRTGERYTQARAALAQHAELTASVDDRLAVHVHARWPWREAVADLPGENDLRALTDRSGATAVRISVVATVRFEQPVMWADLMDEGGGAAPFRLDSPAGIALAPALPRNTPGNRLTRMWGNGFPGSDGTQVNELDTYYYVDAQCLLTDLLADAEAAAPADWQLDIDLQYLAPAREMGQVAEHTEAALRDAGLAHWRVKRVYGTKRETTSERREADPDPTAPVPLDDAPPTGRIRPDALLTLDDLKRIFHGRVIVSWGAWRFTADDGTSTSTTQYDVDTGQVIVSVNEQDVDATAYQSSFQHQGWLPAADLGDEAYIRSSTGNTTVQMRGGPLAVAVWVTDAAGDREAALRLARHIALHAFPGRRVDE
jgi:hypothetical protein